MSPTVLRIKGYRFYFFSREEQRRHIHIYCADGEAKFWIEPEIELAKNYKLNERQINELSSIIKENIDEINDSWKKHFGN